MHFVRMEPWLLICRARTFPGNIASKKDQSPFVCTSCWVERLHPRHWCQLVRKSTAQSFMKCLTCLFSNPFDKTLFQKIVPDVVRSRAPWILPWSKRQRVYLICRRSVARHKALRQHLMLSNPYWMCDLRQVWWTQNTLNHLHCHSVSFNMSPCADQPAEIETCLAIWPWVHRESCYSALIPRASNQHCSATRTD